MGHSFSFGVNGGRIKWGRVGWGGVCGGVTVQGWGAGWCDRARRGGVGHGVIVRGGWGAGWCDSVRRGGV